MSQQNSVINRTHLENKMKIFTAKLDKKSIMYFNVPIPIENEELMLHYSNLLYPDLELFELFNIECSKFGIDAYNYVVTNTDEDIMNMIRASEARSNDKEILKSQTISQNFSNIVVECDVSIVQPKKKKSTDPVYYTVLEEPAAQRSLVGYGKGAIWLEDDDDEDYIYGFKRIRPDTIDMDVETDNNDEVESSLNMEVNISLKRHNDDEIANGGNKILKHSAGVDDAVPGCSIEHENVIDNRSSDSDISIVTSDIITGEVMQLEDTQESQISDEQISVFDEKYEYIHKLKKTNILVERRLRSGRILTSNRLSPYNVNSCKIVVSKIIPETVKPTYSIERYGLHVYTEDSQISYDEFLRATGLALEGRFDPG